MAQPLGGLSASPPPGYNSGGQTTPVRVNSLSGPPSYHTGSNDLAQLTADLDAMGGRSAATTDRGTPPTISKREAEALWEKTIQLFRPILANNSSGLRSYLSKLGFSDVTVLDTADRLFQSIVNHQRPLNGGLQMPQAMPEEFPAFANAAQNSGVFGDDLNATLIAANLKQAQFQQQSDQCPPVQTAPPPRVVDPLAS
ncbi:MAG: hypothetical protein O3A01_02040 [bacterium]|nr:hypothetical protein [bacterium]